MPFSIARNVGGIGVDVAYDVFSEEVEEQLCSNRELFHAPWNVPPGRTGRLLGYTDFPEIVLKLINVLKDSTLLPQDSITPDSCEAISYSSGAAKKKPSVDSLGSDKKNQADSMPILTAGVVGAKTWLALPSVSTRWATSVPAAYIYFYRR
jgi:hypothetical protein